MKRSNEETKKRGYAWLAAMLGCVLASTPVHAQGWIDPARPVPQFGVHKISTHVIARVSGRVATVEVEEQFRNDGPAIGEGDYLYPLPGEAVFNNFSLFQGEQELRGETMDAARARAIYEEIVRRKRDPALIELAGHGLVRARVFPIANGETRKITLRYTQVLTRSGDALQFKYAATPPATGGGRVPVTFRLIIDDAASFGRPFSPTHDVAINRNGGRVTVTPEGSFNGDFDVFMPLRSTTASVTVATHRPASDDGFFMLTLSPARTGEIATPRDITAVVDVSGSMSGEKMEQARAALHGLLASLSPNDRFRLIAFSDQVRVYNPEWLGATRDNVSRANAWIDDLRAEGGTNIAGALAEAFHATSPGERLPFVVFVTDGLPSIGEQNPERIAEAAERARGRTRVFAFGVGYDVNTYLLDRLSAAARGGTQYVRPGESVERAIGTLATRIRFPVLTDLKIGRAPVRIDDIYPRNLPDLFADEELIIVGRYHGAGNGLLTVNGSRRGRVESVSASVNFADHELNNEFIPKLWASRKVGYLTQRIRLDGQNQEMLQELRETALRYGVLSEYTSYLVQEPGAAPPPPPPIAATGAAAVMKSEAARVRGEARSLANVAALEARESVVAQADQQTVGGRVFRKDNGTWIDATSPRSNSVVTIEPFSEAYFALLRSLPELKPYWKQMATVTVAGKHVSIKVAAGGESRLNATRVAEIVKQFRT